MRVAVERQAQDKTLARLGASIAELLEAVTQSLTKSWRGRAAARDAIQQIMALHEHLSPHLGAQDAALAETLLWLRGWATWCLLDLSDSFAQAIESGEDLVADRERVLGGTHPETLASRNDLATAYQDAGAAGGGHPAVGAHPHDAERVLGGTHPDTLTARNDLATAYQDAGRLEEAIPLLERTLTDAERVLGDTHPETLGSRNDLATAYQDAGRLEEAIALLRAHPHRRRAGPGRHPPRHPDRPQQPRYRLPGRRAAGGGHPTAGAHPHRRRAGPGRHPPRHPGLPQQPGHRLPGRWAAGGGHPAVRAHPQPTPSGCWAAPTPRPWAPATTWPPPTRTPGGWRRPSRCTSAPSADAERVLGGTHPDTLTARNNLATAYQDAGRLEEAIALLERTLTDAEHVLGGTHPDTLGSRNNLATAYQDAGRLDEAEDLIRRSGPRS